MARYRHADEAQAAAAKLTASRAAKTGCRADGTSYGVAEVEPDGTVDHGASWVTA
ncbi:MAG: hypothetical protein M3Q61_03715 [Chloroflexota bacterium]|nr:hypothetical protein [Chloroflexota bacterium]